MKRVRVFPIYYSGAAAPEYRSDVFEPLMSGPDPHWAELTAHRKVLEEWLPKHRGEFDYLGFCHYRRFPDFWRKRPSKYLPHVGFERFAKGFAERYTNARVVSSLGDCDIAVPCPSRWGREVTSNYQQYALGGHPQQDLERLIVIVRRRHPEMNEDLDAYLNGRRAYLWLQFVMRADWFEEYLKWQFGILDELAAESDWSTPEYQSYSTIRAPAFLAERFFNVFLIHKERTAKAKLLERQCVFLVPDAETRPFATMKRYLSFAAEMLSNRVFRGCGMLGNML